MSRLVSSDGLLTIPLYHGTSSYFWPSIKRQGLGGKNVADEWQLVSLLEEAVEILASIPDDHIQDELQLRLPILDSILKQRVSAGGFNFRHGAVYVTTSPNRAVSYAARGFGSELLGQAAETVDLLATVRAQEAAALMSRYPEAAAARSAEHRPVLLQINDFHIERLRAEDGGDPQQTVKVADSFMSIAPAIPPQVTFEVAGVIESSEITAADIEVTDWGYGFPRAWTSNPLT